MQLATPMLTPSRSVSPPEGGDMTAEDQQCQTVQHKSYQPAMSHWMLEIPVFINGRGPYPMSVDTGAALTVIVPDLAEELDLETIDTEERHGVGGAVSIDIAAVRSVTAFDIDAGLETVGVSSFPQALCGNSVRGNLGYDVLRHGRLTADFASQRAVFESSPTEPVGGLPFRITSKKKPMIEVEALVNGEGPYPFVVDTGAMGTCISPVLAEALGVEKGEAMIAAGVGGTMDAHFSAEPLSFRIGEGCAADVKPVVLDVFDTLAPETGHPLLGIIGRDILNQYTVTVDYPHSMIRFV